MNVFLLYFISHLQCTSHFNVGTKIKSDSLFHTIHYSVTKFAKSFCIFQSFKKKSLKHFTRFGMSTNSKKLEREL